MKFTHDSDIQDGWRKTTQIPSDFKEVKHLGKCAIDGDMFAAYNHEEEIHIFKGTMEEEHVWKNPTDDEVEVTLTKLAKKKGFENINELTLKDFDGQIFHKGTFACLGNHYIYNDGKLFFDGVVIFKDGEWVEIIEEELTLEQRIKNLEDKIF